MRRRIEVLCVGTELLSGKVNTHIAWLAQALEGSGLAISRETILGDSLEEIAGGVAQAYARSDVLIVCGGLGPTFDDVTRDGVSRALCVPLRYDRELYAKIHARLRRYFRLVPEENKRQAQVLEGARILANAHGSAPGQLLRLGSKMVILLPGPPKEMKAVFSRALPVLKSTYARNTVTLKSVFHLCDITESEADEKLGPVVARGDSDTRFTILASLGRVDFHVSVSARKVGIKQGLASAQRRLDGIRREILGRLGPYVFGADAETLESAVGALLRRRGLKLATAESCTGGLLSERLTSVAGSSDYYLGGIVAYSNPVKCAQLGVPERMLQTRGAVSKPCARAMAEGALRRFGADMGVSITGIAGPGGGTTQKPVGLVFMGLARTGRATQVKKFIFSGDRAQIRERSAVAALTLLFQTLR
ncbi:MAG: competence/damage-inducible protein A [Elusimicrobia bacterium]|nr:competence/damage-inducible protein A [Elusimicrobiota bacterium]